MVSSHIDQELTYNKGQGLPVMQHGVLWLGVHFILQQFHHGIAVPRFWVVQQ